MIKAVLFDLDGTIINSEEGITKCVQYALRAYGIDEPDRTKLRCFIGPPLDPVFREKYGMTEAEAWQSVEKYRERFDVKGIFECSLYDGVREAIARFKEHGYLLALASSKPETACRRILEHFDLLGYFDEVVGSTLDGSISTKAEVLEELGRRMAGSHIGKNELCLIGDTKYDAAGAKESAVSVSAMASVPGKNCSPQVRRRSSTASKRWRHTLRMTQRERERQSEDDRCL